MRKTKAKDKKKKKVVTAVPLTHCLAVLSSSKPLPLSVVPWLALVSNIGAGELVPEAEGRLVLSPSEETFKRQW